MPRRARTVLVVGEDFGNSDPRYHSDLYALTGASGRRLAALCGYEGEGTLPVLQFAAAFARTNVVTLASQWSDKDAVWEGRVDVLYKAIGRRVILLGSRVARAFGYQDLELFDVIRAYSDPGGPMEVVRAPHPSGRSHWWNDPANVERAAEFWRAQRVVAETGVDYVGQWIGVVPEAVAP